MVTLQWEGLQSSHRPIEVYVERAGSYTGPFTELAGPLTDRNNYQDTAIKRGARYYYRLREVVDGTDTYYPTSGGVSIAPEETLAIAEVRRLLYMDLYYGKAFVLYYPVKTFGQRCSCYDATRGRKNTKCLACFGKGFVGGFFNPIVLPIKHTPKQDEGPETSRATGRSLRAMLPGIFPLRKGDVFVDSTNDRFIVAGVEMLRFEGALVKHAITASPVPADNILHQLPADLGLLEKPAKLMVERVS